jgi:hypothetical protein
MHLLIRPAWRAKRSDPLTEEAPAPPHRVFKLDMHFLLRSSSGWTGAIHKWMIPRCMAAVAACVRSFTPSLCRMFFTWFFAVVSAIFKAHAICL